MLTAAARALHREAAPPLILDDPYAAGLAGDTGTQVMHRVRSHVPAGGLASFVTWVCLRGRFTEDLVEEAIRDGIRQYVVLGAGLDSAAYRHPAWLERLKVFEIDHQSSQAWKRSRLEDLQVHTPANVVFAPLDFERETVRDGLVRAGFDVSAPAMTSWMGVTMYLTADAIASTLHSLASFAAGSRLVMTYNQPFERVDAFSRDVTAAIAAAVGDEGEPFVSLFEPDAARALLTVHGFVDVEDYGPDDLKLRYLGAESEMKLAGAQRILVARVG